MTLRARVKHLRKLRHMSQAELARRSGCNRPYIVLLEQGVRNNPTLNVLRKVARGLGVSLGMLMDEVDEENE